MFEVTQPRVTCYRVGVRMDEPQLPALLVAHHRPGFYFRVLQEGEVQADDEITKLATGPEAMTVAEMDGLLYLPRHRRRSLVRALRIPALSEGWRRSFQTLLDQDPGSGTRASTRRRDRRPAWTGFRPFRVAGIDEESASVISIRLRRPSRHPLPRPSRASSSPCGSGPVPSPPHCCGATRCRGPPGTTATE